jgi:hypothetical protein
MPESPCHCYTPWEDHGLRIAQCLEFWDGNCGAEMSPHYQQPCPWDNGYPCGVSTGEGIWQVPIKGEGV